MNYTLITPTFDRVLVEKLKEEVTAGGIIMPIETENTEPDNTYLAKVVARGPHSSVPLGTKVVVGTYAGTELEKKKGFVMIKEADILGTVND